MRIVNGGIGRYIAHTRWVHVVDSFLVVVLLAMGFE